jgi:serine/threonine protein kinase
VEKPIVRASGAPTIRRTGRTGQPTGQTGQETGQTEQRTGQPAGDSPLVLDRYRLHRQLGAGGFGTVWLARDGRLERDVAVKIVARERVSTGRFEREARAAARLAHPGIVTLYEAGADDHGAYLVSEFVLGSTLDELLGEGRLSDRDIVQIGVALCDALSYAHSQGVVHRDVKPSNILIAEHPSSPSQIAKLTDFGVARVIGGDSLTRTGDVLGTAAYMAPEQAEGIEVTAAADLYALALVLYEAVTGVNPIRTSSAAERARRLGAHLPPLRRQRRDLPRELGQGIDLALRPRPRERGRLADLRAALIAALPEAQDDPGIVTAAWRPSPQPNRAPIEPLHDAEEESVDAPSPTLLARVLAALATMALVGWLLAHVVQPWPIAPAAVAVLAGAIIAALPRLGWILIAATLSFSLLLGQRPGSALVLAIGGLIPIASLPIAPFSWPLAAGAPLLGALGLGGAWPAVAACARSAWRRAALGCAGWLWLLLAEPLSGRNLFLGRGRGAPTPDVWTRSVSITVHHVLEPLFTVRALAVAPVWAIAALILPWLVRGRSIIADTVRTTVWAVALATATSTATGGAAQSQALVGALAGAAVALAPSGAQLIRARFAARST